MSDELELDWAPPGVVTDGEEDWLSGAVCNTDNPEECESCQ